MSSDICTTQESNERLPSSSLPLFSFPFLGLPVPSVWFHVLFVRFLNLLCFRAFPFASLTCPSFRFSPYLPRLTPGCIKTVQVTAMAKMSSNVRKTAQETPKMAQGAPKMAQDALKILPKFFPRHSPAAQPGPSSSSFLLLSVSFLCLPFSSLLFSSPFYPSLSQSASRSLKIIQGSLYGP